MSTHFACISALALLCSQICLASDTNGSLAIVEAGIQQTEDAPFVNTDYQFFPGEYVYLEFHVAGFSVRVNSENEARTLNLAYTLAPEDSKGIPLTRPFSGEISEQLGSEDKNWVPVKRASFLLPSFVVGGTYYLHITVQDLLKKTAVEKSLPFSIAGPRFEASDAVGIQHVRFLRREGDREMETPAYSPGDTVYAQFELVHFALKQDNEYDLAYGVTVLRPDGKPFLEEPNAAELRDKTFYPAHYLPAALQVLTKKDSPKGSYTVIISARDLNAGITATTRAVFTIE